MAAEVFDPGAYVRAPIINIANGITLGHALVNGCPAGVAPNVTKSCNRLKATVAAAETAFTARKREEGAISDEDSRVLDREADLSFKGFRMRLLGYSMLPVERYPKAKRAGEIVTILLADEGLHFLTFEYPTQLAHMQSVLRHIDDDKLQAEIDALIGPEFIEQIRDVLPRYATMVANRLKRDKESGQDLGEHVRVLQSCIVDYASKIVALVDPDDAATIQLVRDVLRPINTHRESLAKRAAAGNAETAPAEGNPPAAEGTPGPVPGP